MMKRLGLLVFLVVLAQSCSSSKSKVANDAGTPLSIKKEASLSPERQAVIKTARGFKGTRYKYGGHSKRGMDCSGLIFTAFNEHNISIPRTTEKMESFGNWVDLKEVRSGDLVFFATKKNSRKVNHVGIVTSVMNGDLSFVHASTSKGVIESRLSERYWYFAFVQARRVF
jgi:cell wall-associated NlpC family hydrolase